MMASKTAPEEPLITSKGAWTGSTLVFHYKTTMKRIGIHLFLNLFQIRPTSADEPAIDPSPNDPTSSLQKNTE